jgi:hypothetical protein
MASFERDNVPPSSEIRSALERVTESVLFRGAPQLTAFLRYVVETTLDGRPELIKAYTIAVEALGRSESFDPSRDAIVRVEAGRLRSALSRYYANGGTDDPVVIELPRGTYVPEFRWRAGVEDLDAGNASNDELPSSIEQTDLRINEALNTVMCLMTKTVGRLLRRAQEARRRHQPQEAANFENAADKWRHRMRIIDRLMQELNGTPTDAAAGSAQRGDFLRN